MIQIVKRSVASKVITQVMIRFSVDYNYTSMVNGKKYKDCHYMAGYITDCLREETKKYQSIIINLSDGYSIKLSAGHDGMMNVNSLLDEYRTINKVLERSREKGIECHIFVNTFNNSQNGAGLKFSYIELNTDSQDKSLDKYDHLGFYVDKIKIKKM